jgi:GT2 family glycosyltransferase
VVCAYNAAPTIRECLDSLAACDYPNLEVIVCDDGSTDGTPDLARGYPVRLLQLPHGGLSEARNRGIAASSGEIVAFLDSDAACDPEWPYHLALSLEDDNVVATGGPNLPFPDAGFVERVVAASPGGPVEVLVADDRAEHVPGCNMAFHKEALVEIGCFDPVYRAAGDDVDVCWKLLDRGYEIGFSPAAQVLHHRRTSVRGYLRQQVGYGKAERLMASRHKHRFNRLGQARWAGFIYGGPNVLSRLLRPVVYHGSMGMAPFQPVVGRRTDGALSWLGACLPLLLPLALLGLLAPLDARWLAAPLAALLVVLAYGVAVGTRPSPAERWPLRFRLLVAAMHVAQPFARTWGRLRARAPEPLPRVGPQPWVGERTVWLNVLSQELAARGCRAQPSEAHEPWDLTVRRAPFVKARLTTAVHWRWTPSYRMALRPRLGMLAAAGVTVAAASAGAWYGIFAGSGLALVVAGDAALLVHHARASLRRTTRGAWTRSHDSRAAQDLEAALRTRLVVREPAGDRVVQEPA